MPIFAASNKLYIPSPNSSDFNEKFDQKKAHIVNYLITIRQK